MIATSNSRGVLVSPVPGRFTFILKPKGEWNGATVSAISERYMGELGFGSVQALRERGDRERQLRAERGSRASLMWVRRTWTRA